MNNEWTQLLQNQLQCNCMSVTPNGIIVREPIMQGVRCAQEHRRYDGWRYQDFVDHLAEPVFKFKPEKVLGKLGQFDEPVLVPGLVRADAGEYIPAGWARVTRIGPGELVLDKSPVDAYVTKEQADKHMKIGLSEEAKKAAEELAQRELARWGQPPVYHTLTPAGAGHSWKDFAKGHKPIVTGPCIDEELNEQKFQEMLDVFKDAQREHEKDLFRSIAANEERSRRFAEFMLGESDVREEQRTTVILGREVPLVRTEIHLPKIDLHEKMRGRSAKEVAEMQRRVVEHLEKEAERWWKDKMRYQFASETQRAFMRTPVDTGRARRSWEPVGGDRQEPRLQTGGLVGSGPYLVGEGRNVGELILPKTEAKDVRITGVVATDREVQTKKRRGLFDHHSEWTVRIRCGSIGRAARAFKEARCGDKVTISEAQCGMDCETGLELHTEYMLLDPAGRMELVGVGDRSMPEIRVRQNGRVEIYRRHWWQKIQQESSLVPAEGPHYQAVYVWVGSQKLKGIMPQ